MQGVFDLENFLEVHSIHLQHPGGLRSKHEKAYGHRGEKISIFQSHMQSAVSQPGFPLGHFTDFTCS